MSSRKKLVVISVVLVFVAVGVFTLIKSFAASPTDYTVANGGIRKVSSIIPTKPINEPSKNGTSVMYLTSGDYVDVGNPNVYISSYSDYKYCVTSTSSSLEFRMPRSNGAVDTVSISGTTGSDLGGGYAQYCVTPARVANSYNGPLKLYNIATGCAARKFGGPCVVSFAADIKISTVSITDITQGRSPK